MGTLGDNLLKLTEFPFSYSFIGLLALIFGEGLNLDEPSLEKLGPLLILMGFVATTLSITDPIGALQKVLLRGLRAESPESVFKKRVGGDGRALEGKEMDEGEFGYKSIFGRELRTWGLDEVVLASLSEEVLSKTKDRLQDAIPFTPGRVSPEVMVYVDDSNRLDIYIRALSLRDSTLRTTWIVREIDKITAMGYFIIVVSVFISAVFLLTDFVDKFLVSFQRDDQTAGNGGTTTGGGTNVPTRINAPITTSTPAEGGDLQARIIIIVFSVIALGAVSYMLYRRLRELRRNAFIAFMYLILRQAYLVARLVIKIENETSDKSLQEIEQYLTNGNWTLAAVSLSQIRIDFNDLFYERLKSEKNKLKNTKDYRDLGIY